jgi:TatD DNase family protein
MIDTYTHFNSKTLFNLQSEIEKVNASNLTSVINVGLDLETSKEVINIANNNSKFYSAIGVHPTHEGKLIDILSLYDKSDSRKIVAIGETGLDYDESKVSLPDQKEKFIDSIIIANVLKLPLIIYTNGTDEEVMKIMKIYKPKYGFVYRCLDLNLRILKGIMNLDCFIAIGPYITELFEEILPSNLLAETGYPCMSKSHLEVIEEVFNKIIEVRNWSYKKLDKTLDNNVRRLFKKIYL